MNDKAREAFEAWAKAFGRIFLDRKPKTGRSGVMYENQFTQEAWVGWQAALQWAASQQAAEQDSNDVWPIVNVTVDEAGSITEAKLYSPGLPAGNHDVYPVRVPYLDEHTEAWLACANALRIARPNNAEVGENGIEWAVRTIGELAASQQAAPEGWRIERVSDGDVRVYGPGGETWLLRANPGKGTFEDFAHRLCFALAAAPAQQAAEGPRLVGAKCPHCSAGVYRLDGNGYSEFARCDRCQAVPTFGEYDAAPTAQASQWTCPKCGIERAGPLIACKQAGCPTAPSAQGERDEQ